MSAVVAWSSGEAAMQRVEYAPGRFTVPAHYRVWAALIVGVLVGVVVAFSGPWQFAVLAAWDAAALTFLLWVWIAVRGLDGEQTRRHAVREDPSRQATHVGVLVASVASLASVGLLLAGAPTASTGERFTAGGFAVLSVLLSWTILHGLYLLHYAEQYYTQPVGGVDFGEKSPNYGDFAYLAFTIGMCFQVSDTTLGTALRRTALRHALLSYLFGAVIVAAVVNLVAGLGR